MIDGLGYLIIAAALALAVWGGIAAALDRAPNRWLYIGTGIVAGLMALQALRAADRIVRGANVDTGLFIGYLLTALLLLPGAVVLARMEPTRWGSAIIAAGGLVLAPLVLRLLQIWAAGG